MLWLVNRTQQSPRVEVLVYNKGKLNHATWRCRAATITTEVPVITKVIVKILTKAQLWAN